MRIFAEPKIIIVMRTYFILISILFSIKAFCEPVDGDAAMKIAKRVLKGKDVASAPDVRTRASSDTPAYYIFNSKGSDGFVIVSGDDRFPEVVAYSDNCSFNLDNINPGARAYLDNLAEMVRCVQNGTCQPPVLTSALFADAVGVEPLVMTQWDQGYPFNKLCPLDGGKNSMVGCVATAFAQIMRYWQWPKVGKNKLSHTIALPGYGKVEIDFSKSEYDWSMMPYTKAEISSNEACINAVSKISYECGIATRMNYSAQGSGTYECYAMQALYTYMRYKSSTMEWHRRDCFATQEEWDAIWKAEIDAGRPLLFSGVDAGGHGGHAFVLDGYDAKGYAHINWGWGGNSDGYFLSSLMNGGSSQFSNGQTMITGIEPDYDDTDLTPRQWRAYIESAPSMASKGGSKLGSPKIFTFPMFYNICEFYCKWEVGVGLYDKQGTFIANVKKHDALNGDEFMVQPYRGQSVGMAQVALPTELADGDYTLRCIFKLDGYDEWRLPYMVGGDAVNSVPVRVEDGMAYYNEVSTGVDELRTAVMPSTTMYNLQGVPVTNPQKGQTVVVRSVNEDGSISSRKILVK